MHHELTQEKDIVTKWLWCTATHQGMERNLRRSSNSLHHLEVGLATPKRFSKLLKGASGCVLTATYCNYFRVFCVRMFFIMDTRSLIPEAAYVHIFNRFSLSLLFCRLYSPILSYRQYFHALWLFEFLSSLFSPVSEHLSWAQKWSHCSGWSFTNTE